MNPFHSVSDSIDILINNAGLAVGKYQLTADGHEMTWATNHLGEDIFIVSSFALWSGITPKLAPYILL